MRLIDIDKNSIKFYITEELRNDPRYTAHWDRLDEGFFKPWQQHLKLLEAELTADQIQQIFAASEKASQTSGGNATVLGKIVDKIIPSAMLGKLHSSLPEPDPNAQADPEFEAKASASVQKLQAPEETKSGLMAVVKAAAKNPQAQAMVLSLVGGALGGLMNVASPLIQSIFPGGGTMAVGITGAIVAGGVAVAAAKLQGKPWKEAFTGAIKPALAGAAGAVLGSLAANFVGGAANMAANAVKGKDGQSPAGGDPTAMNTAINADEQKMSSITGKYPPEDGFQYDASGKNLVVTDANGNKVFTGDIQPQTMDMKTFADLANAGKTVQQQTNVGTGNQIGSGSAALDDFLGGPDKYDKMQTALSTPEKAAIGQDVAQQMGLSGGKVKFQGNVPVSVDGQPVPQDIQQSYGGAAAGGPSANPMANKTRMPGGGNYGDPTGMGAASDYQPVDTGSLRQGGAPGGVAFPGDPGYVPPDEAGKIRPFANKTRMPKGAESIHRTGQPLSEGQIYMIFNRVVARNDRLLTEGWLVEGPLDFIKNAAKNLTRKVTADKLNKAWKAAGSPMDSESVAKVLADAEVNADVVKKVYADLKIDAGAAPAAVIDIETVKQMLAKLPVDSKARLLKYLTKQPETAAA